MVVVVVGRVSGMRISVTFPPMNRCLGCCLKVESWYKLSPEATFHDGWVGAHGAPGGWQGGGGEQIYPHLFLNLLSPRPIDQCKGGFLLIIVVILVTLIRALVTFVLRMTRISQTNYLFCGSVVAFLTFVFHGLYVNK